MWDLLVNIAGVASGLVLCVSYIPQIINLYKTKTTEGVSTSFWLILDLSLLMLFILAIDSGSGSLIFAQALNLVLALVVTAQVLYYNKRNK